MAERSQFWDTGTTGDGTTTITQAQTTEWFRDVTTPRSGATSGPSTSQGVFRRVMNELAVSGAASPVSVNSGAATVAGFYYKNDAAVSVAIPTPAANTRIDRIVLRAIYGTTRTVRITRIAGVEGLGTPPALTQSDGATWDIPLAQVSITTGGVVIVTDERVFAQFATNHVKRDGDTMTGGLTAPALIASHTGNPTLRMIAQSSPANNQYWQWIVSGAVMSLQLANDAYTLFANVLTVTRSANTTTEINFPSGGDVVKSGSNPILHTGNMALRVVTAWIADLAVTTAKIADGAVTLDKIANLAVATAKLANGAVTLAKTDFVPRRQGGNASNWSVAGTNNYIPATVFPQIGAVEVTLTGSTSWLEQSVTFPATFFYAPLVFVSVTAKDTAYPGGPLATINVRQATTTNMTFELRDTATSGTRIYTVTWLALGGKELV